MSSFPDAPTVPLALTNVMASGLPVDLGEENAEFFYDVPAVFNRRPDRSEMDALRGQVGHDRLYAAGYGEVTMEVRDRRLIIGHTNLEQLQRGLSTVIADIIDDVSRASLHDKEQLRAGRQAHLDERTAREGAIARTSDGIRFVPTTQHTHDGCDEAAGPLPSTVSE